LVEFEEEWWVFFPDSPPVEVGIEELEVHL